jgi:hypothetical protein
MGPWMIIRLLVSCLPLPSSSRASELTLPPFATVTVLLTFGWPSMLWIDFLFASIVPLYVLFSLALSLSHFVADALSFAIQHLPPLPLPPPHRAPRVLPHPRPLLLGRAPQAALQDGHALQGAPWTRVPRRLLARRMGHRLCCHWRVYGCARLAFWFRLCSPRSPILSVARPPSSYRLHCM